MKRILFLASALLVITWIITMILLSVVSLFVHVLLIAGLFLALQAVIITPANRREQILNQ